MIAALYNDNDRYCAAWLRNLIAAKQITSGNVDERGIADLEPADLSGYRRAHFFAGIGGWDLALRLAGWPDDRPVWTGSCPCQPFSSAGKRKAGADERHLWPQWLRLIRECRPDTIFGEQVEGAVGLGWLDRVFADLENEGYACGAAVLGAHSVGAPHIRQRLFWVADAGRSYSGRSGEISGPSRAGKIAASRQGRHGRQRIAGGNGADGRMADTERLGQSRPCGRVLGHGDAPCRADAGDSGPILRLAHSRASGRRALQRAERADGRCAVEPDGHSDTRGSGSALDARLEERAGERRDDEPQRAPAERAGGAVGRMGDAAREQMGRARQPWEDGVWLDCLDGKARRTFRRLQLVAPRLSGGVATDRTSRQEKEIGDGTPEGDGANQKLRCMRDTSRAEAVQWHFGEHEQLSASQILRPKMHGVRDDGSLEEAADSARQPQAFREDEYWRVRELWEHVKSSRSPQGRKSAEQRAIELGDVVHVLSHQRALADLEGDKISSEGMFALSEACKASGIMQYTLHAISEVWRSLPYSRAARWRMGSGSPLAVNHGPVSRVGALRGAGNAIVAQAAAEFVSAFLSVSNARAPP